MERTYHWTRATSTAKGEADQWLWVVKGGTSRLIALLNFGNGQQTCLAARTVTIATTYQIHVRVVFTSLHFKHTMEENGDCIFSAYDSLT